MRRMRRKEFCAFNDNANLLPSSEEDTACDQRGANDNYYLTQITQITLIYGSVFDLKIYQKSERKILEHESHGFTRIISYRCFVSHNLSVYENKFSTHLCYT